MERASLETFRFDLYFLISSDSARFYTQAPKQTVVATQHFTQPTEFTRFRYVIHGDEAVVNYFYPL